MSFTIVAGGWDGATVAGEKYVRVKTKEAIPADAILFMYKNKKKIGAKSPDYLFFKNGWMKQAEEKSIF